MTKNQDPPGSVPKATLHELPTTVLFASYDLSDVDPIVREELESSRRAGWFQSGLHSASHLDMLAQVPDVTGITETSASLLELLERMDCYTCELPRLSEAATAVAKFLQQARVPLQPVHPDGLDTLERAVTERHHEVGSDLLDQFTRKVQDLRIRSLAHLTENRDEFVEVGITLAALGADELSSLDGVVSALGGDHLMLARTLADLEDDPALASQLARFKALHAERLTCASTSEDPVFLVANRRGSARMPEMRSGIGDPLVELYEVPHGRAGGTLRLPEKFRPQVESLERLAEWERELLDAPDVAELRGDSEEVIDTALRFHADGMDLPQALVLARAI